MNYKVILYNSKFYKEIKLQDSLKQGVLIGTSKECQIRFFREQFFTDFMIRISLEGNQWIVTCEDSIYLKKDNAFKTYMQYIQPQDVIKVCYDMSDTELFTIEFTVDFDIMSNDYDRRIDISNITQMTIGGGNANTIQIQNAEMKEDYIRLVKAEQGYQIYQEKVKYFIMVNGFQERNKDIHVKNQSFIALNGYSFYIKDNLLYTSKEYPIATTLPNDIMMHQKNQLQYPRFIRSARQQFEIPEESIDILPPKSKPTETKKNLVMTMVPLLVSMGMMTMMRMSMGSNKAYAIMCVGMSAVSIVMSVVNYKNEGILYKKNLVKRENDYNRYIAEQEEKIIKVREKEQIITKQKYPSLEERIQFVEDFDARLFEMLFLSIFKTAI